MAETCPEPNHLWLIARKHLQELRTPYGFAASEAGSGLYHALFGRDSLWTLMFLLEAVRRHSAPHFAAWVEAAACDIFLRLTALQGIKVYDSTEEQPGKILHEYRDALDERLQTMGLGFENGRSYSGFDQTFLFVIAFHRFGEAFPNSRIISEVWPAIERALDWIERHADDDGDGLFEYRRRNNTNLLNQVWKDSFDSIVQTGADVPSPPIAWIEVQAYAYQAFLSAAALYRQHGNEKRACHFERRARVLQAQVNEQFWLEDESCFAIALDGRKLPITMISSNAGHALWAGIVTPSRESSLVRRLLESDMTTRYGIRTLSAHSPFYAPFTYHRGCIWPFDNGVFVLGLLRHGFHDEAHRLIEGVCKALTVIGSPIELYIVLDPTLFISFSAPEEILSFRKADQENRNQGWTAATMLFFAAVLAEMTGTPLPDA